MFKTEIPKYRTVHFVNCLEKYVPSFYSENKTSKYQQRIPAGLRLSMFEISSHTKKSMGKINRPNYIR